MSEKASPNDGPAVAVVELSSIARAFPVTDAMVKRAPSMLWRTHTISPGRFLIILKGGVAEVEESLLAGIDAGDTFVIDHVFLPNAEPQILSCLMSPPKGLVAEALGIIETTHCAAAVRSADAALKGAEVRLAHIHLGQGIGGKGIYAFTGALHDVQAALAEGFSAAGEGFVLTCEEIPAPHGAMTLSMLGMGSASPDY